MDVLNTTLLGNVPRISTIPVDESNPASDEWVGLNRSCTLIPENALQVAEERIYQNDDTPVDEWGRYQTIEWADQADWYGSEHHSRGWITLAKSNDTGRGSWARKTRTKFEVEQLPDGTFKLAKAARELITEDLTWYRELLEDVCEHDLYDAHTHSPPLFDIERVEGEFESEEGVHRMAMDAKRTILDICGHLAWWTASVPGWLHGLDNGVVEKVWSLDLRSFPARGYLISVNQDWREINFPLLVQMDIPLYYVWGPFEQRDPRFTRLDPRVVRYYLQEVDSQGVRGLWSNEIPVASSEFEVARRYDQFLQLRIHPYARPRSMIPEESALSGRVEYWVIDFQYWGRRLLRKDENWRHLDKLYHHIIVESRSEERTRVIFQRFHPKPRNETLASDDSIMDEDLPEPDLCAIREIFKGKCAPRVGQTFDSETGVERTRPLGEEDPIRRPRPRGRPPPYADARSYVSISSHDSRSRAGTPRRSASPDSRVRRVYPLRGMSPPQFRPRTHDETLGGLQDGRAGWLNDFVRWGEPATFRASLWRIPAEFSWRADVLEYGYLIISEPAEFRLRYQAIADPNIRFPRHLLELAMERSIPFAIGFKSTDTDRFRPPVLTTGRQVTKAVVDRRSKGPRLSPSSSISVIIEEFRNNLGKIGTSPLAPSIMARGGGASWILRAFIGIELVRGYMQGPSIQVSVHHCGANDSGDANSIDVTWDEMADGEYEAIFGYIPGATPAEDVYLFPTDEMLEEYSDHYFREWNPFCDLTFKRIKKEIDDNAAKRRTRKDWQKYFQSSNRGKFAPKLIVNRAFVEEGMERIQRAFETQTWNKRRIKDLKRDLPALFRLDF
ncbi:hypothetical protein DFH09DRAFT_955248 [Mycena vulgaris]|nr:hypothetical protein DFH09DRAFT_955248 [Mycena vulgaris]